MNARVQRIIEEVQSLTVPDLRELRDALRDLWDDDGGTGVREPRRPHYPSGSSSTSVTTSAPMWWDVR